EGDPTQIAHELAEGHVVLGTVLSQRMKLHRGDTINLGPGQGPQRCKVAGVAIDFQVGGMMLYMQRSAAKKVVAISGADLFLVRTKDEARDDVGKALQELCPREGLILQSFAELGRFIDHIMGGVEAGLWAILALEFIVAGFGIANTLTMN